MASVNLWQLITTVASKDCPDTDRCKAIKSITSPRFGTELTLEIKETGVWVVEIFDHQDSRNKITLSINPNGFISVTRCRPLDSDISETRTVQF